MTSSSPDPARRGPSSSAAGGADAGSSPPPSARVQEQEFEELLRDGLQRVLPSALVEATEEAQAAVASLSRGPERTAVTGVGAASLAAALGSSAATTVASALSAWLRQRLAEFSGSRWPSWLRPDLSANNPPRIATLTEFSQQRTQYIRAALAGTPVLLTRHGTVVAAVVPLEPGAYERDVYPAAMREIAGNADSPQNSLLPERRLTDSELEELHRSHDVATAAGLGIDTTGWDALNPPPDPTSPQSSPPDAAGTSVRADSKEDTRTPGPSRRKRRDP